MSRIEVLIPRSNDDDEQRQRVGNWIDKRWVDVHGLSPMWATCPESQWSKGSAVNAAISIRTYDLLIVADADSFVDHDELTRAIEQAELNGWAIPHSVIKRLDQRSTELVLDGQEPGDVFGRLERGTYPARTAGGIVIARRDVWQQVRGIDPRFIGWGGEDHALWMALHTLIGPVNKRQGAPLWHLWHPPAPRWMKPLPESSNLADRHKRAARAMDKNAMAALIREW